MTESNIRAAITKTRSASKNVEITRQGDLHADIEIALFAVAGAALNTELRDYLADNLALDGAVQGRSKTVKLEPEEDLPPVQETYPRPNGELYYARDWGIRQDVTVMKTLREEKLSPLLFGEPGTGKTALTDATFPDLLTVVVTADTQVADLVGQFIPNPDFGSEDEPEFQWVDGPLTVAMVEGRPILLDEIGLGDAKILSILYGVMDGRGELVITANPKRGTITAAEGFHIIGATNPNAPGVRMSEALLSRFAVHVEVTTDWNLAIKLGVPSKIVGIAQRLSNMQKDNQIMWSPQFRELLAFRDIQKKFDETFAVSNLLAVCPAPDRAQVQETLSKVYGSKAVSARI